MNLCLQTTNISSRCINIKLLVNVQHCTSRKIYFPIQNLYTESILKFNAIHQEANRLLSSYV